MIDAASIPSFLTAEGNPAVNELSNGTNTSKANAARTRLSDDFDSFMKLLTTQLKNQDPTDPLDTNEFTNQLVLFSGVEQSIATNENLERLISLTSNQTVNTAVSFVGKAVEAKGTAAVLAGGNAEFAYAVPAGAATVTLAVTRNGAPVYVAQGETKAGKHVFSWDGSNSFNSSKMPDGEYQFGLLVKDAKGNTLKGQTFTTGKVTSIAMADGDMVLTLDGALEIPLEEVTAIRDGSTAAN